MSSNESASGSSSHGSVSSPTIKAGALSKGKDEETDSPFLSTSISQSKFCASYLPVYVQRIWSTNIPGFLEFIHELKQWTRDRLPRQSLESGQKLLEAFEELFEKEAPKLLGVKAFGDEGGKDKNYFYQPSSLLSEESMRSFHQAQFIRSVRQSVWLELVTDLFPDKFRLEEFRLPTKTISARAATLRSNDTDPGATSSSGTVAGRLVIKLRMPEMKSGPGSLFETISLDKGIWCWSSRKTYSTLEASFPNIKLLSPPMTWRRDGQEVHVYHIVIPENEGGEYFSEVLFDLRGFVFEVSEGKLHQTRGERLAVYHVSISCSEFDCTKKWMPKCEAVVPK